MLAAWSRCEQSSYWLCHLLHGLQAVRALCGSGTQLQTQALLHEKIQCLKQLGLKGENMQRAENSPFMSCRLALALCLRHLTHFTFFLSLSSFFFNLPPLSSLSGERAELSVSAGLCRAENRLRKKCPGRTPQESAAESSRFAWLRRQQTRTVVTPIAVRGGWDGDLKPESLKVTVLPVRLGRWGEIHDGKKQRTKERSCFCVVCDFVHFMDFLLLVHLQRPILLAPSAFQRHIASCFIIHLTMFCLCRCPISGLQRGPHSRTKHGFCVAAVELISIFSGWTILLFWCYLIFIYVGANALCTAAIIVQMASMELLGFLFFSVVLKWCTLTLMCYWMGPGIVFCLFSIMPLSMRPISSLENVLHEQGRWLRKEKKEEKNHVSWQFSCRDGRVMCIKGRQSSCNYSGTWANGPEESTQKSVYTVNILSQIPRWAGQV